jgi:Cof subfamily protein (haloacid dehalogenase superfamily)
MRTKDTVDVVSSWVPRVVATDLDGTIVRSDGTVSPRTVAALARVEAAGATVVMVTGRPPRWIQPVAEATGHRGVVICSNGALVYDLHSESIIGSTTIPAGVVAKVVAILLGSMPDLAFAVETGTDVFRGHGYRGGWDLDAHDPFERFDLDVVTSVGAAKLLASHPSMEVDELLGAVTGLVGDLVEPTHSNGRGLVEMGPRGVSKATTLAGFCVGIGVTAADVVAFGDMPNDLPMLAWANMAYAVANAHSQVLAAVPLRAASNDEDGVAQIIEKLFPDNRE